MSTEYLNTKEVADYLGINEKQVYALIKGGKIPCTRVTGKWLFPRRLIDDWISASAQTGTPQSRSGGHGGCDALLAAGSNDPVLDILLNTVKRQTAGCVIFSAVVGSSEGLRMLGAGETDIAWCHLGDPVTGSYDIQALSALVNDRKIAIVHLFLRELGFIVAPGISIASFDINSLASNNVRFINRQQGSGTRILIDYHLAKNGISPSSVRGYQNEVFTHFEVGLHIVSKNADVGVATRAVASILNLPFSPLVNEGFDMVLGHDTFFRDEVQAFIEQLKSAEFRSQIAHLGNYDFVKSGKILYSST